MTIEPSSIVDALDRPITNGVLDVVAPISIVPEHGSGFPGRPGLAGHRRGGLAWAPRFAPAGVERTATGALCRAVDDVAGLRLDTDIDLADVLSVRCTLTNTGDTIYMLDRLVDHAAAAGARHRVADLRRSVDPRAAPVPAGVGAGRVRQREPPRPHVARARAAGVRRRGGLRRVAGRGVGRSPRVERQPRAARRVAARRPPATCSSASCCTPESWRSSRARPTDTPHVVAVHSTDGLTPATWGFHRSVRARTVRADAPTAGAAEHVGGRVLRPRPRPAARARQRRGSARRRAVRPRRRLVRIPPRRPTGARRLGGVRRRAPARTRAAHRARARRSAWSSASGSSPRW